MSEVPGRQARSFASLAHRAVVGSKRWSVAKVSAQLNIKENTLYTKLEGRSKFDVEEARDLIGVLGDVELANYILERSPFLAAEKLEVDVERTRTLERQAGRAVWEAADALRAIEEAVVDGKLDHREKVHIRGQIEEAERAIVSLKNLLSGS